jgi:predicted acylesterase/phospholipase RssA
MTREPTVQSETSAPGTNPADSYAAPPRQCDVVMSGGVTSGIVYPRVITGLAQEYQFRCVGGTSAGAIAAAATAAAEYCRQQGIANGRSNCEIGNGFALLDVLPQLLSQNGKLFSLFQPSSTTAPVFSLGIACLGNPTGRTGRLATAALTAFPLEAAGGAVIGAFVGLLPAWFGVVNSSWHVAYTTIGSLFLTALGAILGVLTSIVSRVLGPFVEGGFGFCSGMRGADVSRSRRGAVQSGDQALSEWLTDYLNQVAGKPIGAGPLTFGDLWYADAKDPEDSASDTKRSSDIRSSSREPVIRLEMMTSCVTLGRPFQLPKIDRSFFYRRTDMEALFPKAIVNWMMAHAGKPKNAAEQAVWPVDSPFVALPDAEYLPVVVGVRLSLSFPALFTAVRLFAIDESRTDPADRVPEPCWFSDGGLTSNFPVNFFDAPLPRRPTFAINLSPAPDDDPNADVAMPETMMTRVAEQWTRFDHIAPGLHDRKAPSATAMLAGLFGAILDTAKNWHDALQIRVPGYRERVATVYLQPGEGGLTVNMPSAVVARVSERGAEAAAVILSRYATPGDTNVTLPTLTGDVPVSWSAHRWGRYRSTMNVIQNALRQFSVAFAASPLAGDPSLTNLVSQGCSAAAPFGYPFLSPPMAAGAPQATAQFGDVLNQWQRQSLDFGDKSGPPAPTPELRIVPQP